MISFRYATSADIDRFYGERPRPTMRAVVAMMDGEPMGVIGLAKRGEVLHAFSEYKPQIATHLKCMTVLRMIKFAVRMFEEAKLPIYAMAESDNGLLERLGFERVREDLYRWRS